MLDARNGLAVGQNLLFVSAGRRGRLPRWEVPVRFVVGYRKAHLLGVSLRLGAGTRPAATALWRQPSTGVASSSAWLNGVAVRVPAGAGRLDLAHLGALRWGSNRLRVRLVMTDGQVENWSRAFRLDRRRNVAIARRDGPAVVGRAVGLDASRSLIVPAAHQAGRIRWLLVRRPRNSRARLGRPRGARITLRPDVPGDYRVALVVGRGSHRGYDLQTVSATYPEPLVPLDTITDSSDGTPGVQVGNDFYATSPGFPLHVVVLKRDTLELVGNASYQASSQQFAALEQAWKQLPSSDLVIVTHAGPAGPLPADTVSSLDDALNAIGGSLAAKSVLQPGGGCWSGATDAGGGSGCEMSWQRSSTYGGSFTVIGVPGLAAGQAWRETAAQTHGEDARILGYLTPGTATQTGGADYYTVINGRQDTYSSVDTCAGSNCAVRVGVNIAATTTAGSATITSVTPTTGYADGASIAGPGIPSGATIASGAGTSTLTISSPAGASESGAALIVHQDYAPTSGASGLHVVAVDRTTLAPILNRTVNNTTDLQSALQAGPIPAVGHLRLTPYLDDQRLFIVQSVGDGVVSGPADTQLLQYMDELGGTPDLLTDTLKGGSDHRYALVGAATNLPWRNASALESSAMIPVTHGAQKSQLGRLAGVLARDRQGLYTPLTGNPVGSTSTDLYRILYQPAQPWPYANDTQELNYIATKIGLSAYPDVRSAYQNLLIPWASKQLLLNNLECTSASDCGDTQTFETVKQQLCKEFDWTQTVQNFATELHAPYQQIGSEPYFDVQAITGDVKNTVSPSGSASVTMKWLAIMTRVTEIGSAVAELSGNEAGQEFFGILGAAGVLANAVLEQPNSNGGPADQVSTTAAQLDEKMAAQQTGYNLWVDEMEKILLYDYGKLRDVGTAVGTDPAWTWTSDTTRETITALQAGTAASAYSALVPAAWSGYNLKPDDKTQTSSDDVKQLRCDPEADTIAGQHHNYPFAPAGDAPNDRNLFHAATRITNGAPVDEVWLFANLDLNVWSSTQHLQDTRTAQLPSATVVAGVQRVLSDNIYGPTSTEYDPANSVVGAYQYEPVWWRNTYNPPAHTICKSAPLGEIYQPSQVSVAYPPPNLMQPLP